MPDLTGKRDPLVRLLPSRLDEARKAVGLSVSGLARKAGVRQQTLHAILHAQDERRCRQSIRNRLAKALDLPTYQSNGARWLGGEEARLRTQGSGLGDRHPSRAGLALLRLMERCRSAWTREQHKGSDRSVPQRPASIREGAEFHLFEGAIEQLTSCIWWRNHIYSTMSYPPTRAEYEAERHSLPKHRRKEIAKRDASGQGPLIWDEMTAEEREHWLKWPPEAMPPALTDEAADRIEQGFIAALEGLLEPWLSGEADIRYEWLVAMRSEGNRIGREG